MPDSDTPIKVPIKDWLSVDEYQNGRIRLAYIHLDDGRVVSLFVNKNTNLVVLDIVDADESGGVEVYRNNV